MSNGALRIELFVDDIERSVSFYERVLGLQRGQESTDYVSLRRGSAVIGIGRMSLLPEDHPAKARFGERCGLGVEIVLEVDDVAGVYATVQAAGHALSSLIQQRPWGLTDFRVVDPDGYYVRVTSVS